MAIYHFSWWTLAGTPPPGVSSVMLNGQLLLAPKQWECAFSFSDGWAVPFALNVGGAADWALLFGKTTGWHLQVG